MSRMDDIRKRARIVEHFNDDRADVNYLLSKLEIAEHALKYISRNEPVKIGSYLMGKPLSEVALEALQSIREE